MPGNLEWKRDAVLVLLLVALTAAAASLVGRAVFLERAV
jgi:hypothetical protein